MYNIYYKRMKLKLIHVNMHGKGSFVQKLFNTQNNFKTKILRFLVQARANVYTHTLTRPSNGRGCHNHLCL